MDPSTGGIIKYYESLPGIMGELKKALNRPLTLAEKIFYSHLSSAGDLKNMLRGIDYAFFRPDRVAMQDATAQMAMLQFMLAGKETSLVPASIHCDHLIIARKGDAKDLKDATKENAEVYDFLRSVAERFNIDFWEPGEGIIHQVVMENYAFPGGMMIGTDSHTPTAGGLGMLAIGVGGADAVDVMTGTGWELRFPKLIGIKLTGKLSGWASAKDLILKISGMLSVKGGTGSVIEYFGEGAQSLSSTGKATICNMGAETGATCSLFGFDDKMAAYLAATGRKDIAESAFMVREHLKMDEDIMMDPGKYFDNYFEINLGEIEPYINGPFTPDLATPISRMKELAAKNGWPQDISAGLIGSCTNSSYEDISRAASVLKNALDANIRPAAPLKISPGSQEIKKIAEKHGLLAVFKSAGAEVFANACGPCIGQWDRNDSGKTEKNTIIHSFNRNFARRTDGNPDTFAFVASPEIVTALSIAGKLTFNPLTDSLVDAGGRKVHLAEPRGSDLPAGEFHGRNFSIQRKGKESKKTITVDPASERLQLLKPFEEWDGRDFVDVPLLIKAKGKCTTDHISMAGKWLRYRGHLENISNNYMIGAVNFFNGETDRILNQLNGKYGAVPAVAAIYKKKGVGSVVVGEENFGEGSSREHAAMEPRFFKVRAVLVKSFARIHETNLKKQGILTLTFADKADYDRIREDDRFDITGLREFAPGKQLNIVLHHSDGTKEKFTVNHSYNEIQIEWFKSGSALNMIRRKGNLK